MDVPGGADVSYVDSDEQNDATVTVDGSASVAVTNTFEKKPGTVDGSDVLPDNGGPAFWLLLMGLLSLGVGVVLVGLRQKRS